MRFVQLRFPDGNIRYICWHLLKTRLFWSRRVKHVIFSSPKSLISDVCCSHKLSSTANREKFLCNGRKTDLWIWYYIVWTILICWIYRKAEFNILITNHTQFSRSIPSLLYSIPWIEMIPQYFVWPSFKVPNTYAFVLKTRSCFIQPDSVQPEPDSSSYLVRRRWLKRTSGRTMLWYPPGRDAGGKSTLAAPLAFHFQARQLHVDVGMNCHRSGWPQVSCNSTKLMSTVGHMSCCRAVVLRGLYWAVQSRKTRVKAPVLWWFPAPRQNPFPTCQKHPSAVGRNHNPNCKVAYKAVAFPVAVPHAPMGKTGLTMEMWNSQKQCVLPLGSLRENRWHQYI